MPGDKSPRSQNWKETEGLRERAFHCSNLEPSVVEKSTPDEIFLIDAVPDHKNVIIGTGFSGTGFKTSPVVGKLLSQLAMGTQPFLDTTPFQLSRFKHFK
ncbi:peroxisomal sarcosine oxidase [Caerostris extrusa]|uniref:Peroxisomal sarcosine oxidase n=1 Tax=Caerostris extrusa TaxID=172846 RepID=A0AAV4QPI4_CAEEX|nr:peroxisomal sarcosine oxidase [Caerostris extrusa]